LVGSDRPLPLQELRRAPWQVILFRGIDGCAGSIRDTIAQALDSGSFTDAMGRSLPLGAAVVVLTAPALDQQTLLAPVLGPSLIAACEVVSGTAGAVPADARDAWLRTELLDPLAARLARQGYTVKFDAAFAAWLAASLPAEGSPSAFLDRSVTPLLVASLPARPGPITVTVANGQPTIAGRRG
jgi:hypothetical protein